MKNFKTYAIAAVMAGALALPLAAANAEGYGGNDGSAAGAAAGGAITSQSFKALDTDRSGTLSEAEFSKYSGASVDFKQADSNGDGRLTLSEVQSLPAQPKTSPGAPSSTAN